MRCAPSTLVQRWRVIKLTVSRNPVRERRDPRVGQWATVCLPEYSSRTKQKQCHRGYGRPSFCPDAVVFCFPCLEALSFLGMNRGHALTPALAWRNCKEPRQQDPSFEEGSKQNLWLGTKEPLWKVYRTVTFSTDVWINNLKWERGLEGISVFVKFSDTDRRNRYLMTFSFSPVTPCLCGSKPAGPLDCLQYGLRACTGRAVIQTRV